MAPSSFVLAAACASARTPERIPDDPVLGRPLVIHGRVVPWSELRQAVCEGSAGAAAIERDKLVILIDEELQRRVKSGGSARIDFDLDEDEMNAFKKDLEKEIADESLGVAEPGRDLQMVFQKVFLPRDPDQFPPATIEALMSQAGGQEVIDHYKATFATRKSAPEPKHRSAAEREFDDAIAQQVLQSLLENAKIEPAPAPGVLDRVNGVDIKIDDIWAEILPSLSEADVREAKQWIANTTVLREALEEARAWLSDEEAEAAYLAYSDPYRDSAFSIERLALEIKRFPSVERYKEYRHIYESFMRMKAAQMTPEALEKQAEFRTNPIVGQVTVDVDVILCSAWDFERKCWKQNGWAEAEQRMKEVQRALVEGGVAWDECVERYSELPVSTEGEEKPSGMKGRIRHIQRNPLMARLGDSEYLQFLNGTSLTDSIFFEQEPGTLGTPVRGAYGWYLPRLIRRSPTPAKLQVDPETMHVLEVDDYVQWNLNLWAQELLQRSLQRDR